MQVQNLFRTSKLLGEMNATIVAVVPKVTNASTLHDYHCISCCNIMYKCIMKIFTIRRKKATQKLVSSRQSAFVPGRVIQDNILHAHENEHFYYKDDGRIFLG